jgi:hypothetical protein
MMGALQLRTAAHHSTRRALGVVAALQPPRAYAYACMLRYGSSSSTCTGARCARAHVTKTNQQDHTPRLHRICFNNGGGAAGEWVHHDHESPAVYVRRVFRLVIVDRACQTPKDTPSIPPVYTCSMYILHLHVVKPFMF